MNGATYTDLHVTNSKQFGRHGFDTVSQALSGLYYVYARDGRQWNEHTGLLAD